MLTSDDDVFLIIDNYELEDKTIKLWLKTFPELDCVKVWRQPDIQRVTHMCKYVWLYEVAKV